MEAHKQVEQVRWFELVEKSVWRRLASRSNRRGVLIFSDSRLGEGLQVGRTGVVVDPFSIPRVRKDLFGHVAH